jgi:hypothetical protein
VTPEQAKEISDQIRAARAQHERMLEKVLSGITDPREIDRITGAVINVQKDILSALKRFRDLLSWRRLFASWPAFLRVNKIGREWKLPVALTIGVVINLTLLLSQGFAAGDCGRPPCRISNKSMMVVRITLGAANPEIAFQLKSQVQEHILDYLKQFRKGSLLGAVADPNPQWSRRKQKSTETGTSGDGAPIGLGVITDHRRPDH